MPLMPVALCVAAGVAGGRYVEGDLAVAVVLVAVAVLFGVALWRDMRWVMVLSLAFGAGWLSMMFHRTPQIDWENISTRDRCVGIVDDVRVDDAATVADIDVKAFNDVKVCAVRVAVTMADGATMLRDGDIVSFNGRWSAPRVERDMPYCDDLSELYYLRGVSARCYCMSDSVRRIGESGGIMYTLRRGAGHIRHYIYDSGLDTEAAQFVAAVVIGEDDVLTDRQRQEFSVSGLGHILALSGMHVGLVAMFASALLWPMAMGGWRRQRMVGVVAIVWAYAMMTGLGASVTRAAIMVTVMMIARLLQRRHSSLNAVCCAAVILLLFDPLNLFRAGFQLSFAAVIAIILLSRRLNPVDIRRHPALYSCVMIITVPLSAVIGTAVPMLFYFHSFQPLFLLSNIPMAFLVPVIFAASLLLILVTAAGMQWHWLTWLVDTLYDMIDGVATWTAEASTGITPTVYIGWGESVTLFVALITVVMLLFRRDRVAVMTASVAVAVAVAVCVVSRPEYPEREYYVTRDTRSTTIFVYESGHYRLLRTFDYHDGDACQQQFERRYTEYFGRRGAPRYDGYTDVSRHMTMIPLGRDTLCIVSAPDVPDSLRRVHVRYALICKNFSGDIAEFAEKIDADTIVLLHELNGRKAQRLARELDDAGVPYINMRTRGRPLGGAY